MFLVWIKDCFKWFQAAITKFLIMFDITYQLPKYFYSFDLSVTASLTFKMLSVITCNKVF